VTHTGFFNPDPLLPYSKSKASERSCIVLTYTAKQGIASKLKKQNRRQLTALSRGEKKGLRAHSRY